MEKIFFEKLSSEAKALWLNQNIKFNLFSDGETDLLAVCGLNKKDQDAVLPYLKEIKAALLAEKEWNAKRREKRRESIPGVREYRAAIEALREWQDQIEEEGFDIEADDFDPSDPALPAKPEVLPYMVLNLFPEAYALMTIEDVARESNQKIKEIGNRYLDAVLDDGMDPVEARKQMEKSLKENCPYYEI